MKHKFNSESGLTLIELMFAAGVLTVALSMLFGSLISVSLMGRLSESRSVAASDLTSVMEELQSVETLSALLEYEPPELFNLGPLETITIEVVLDGGTRIALPAERSALPSILPDPLAVECTVSWYTERRPMSLTVTKLMAT